MRYQIISVSTVSGLSTDFEKAGIALSELVNAALSEGWKPLGGVAIGHTQSTMEPYLFQAMTKD